MALLWFFFKFFIFIYPNHLNLVILISSRLFWYFENWNLLLTFSHNIRKRTIFHSLKISYLLFLFFNFNIFHRFRRWFLMIQLKRFLHIDNGCFKTWLNLWLLFILLGLILSLKLDRPVYILNFRSLHYVTLFLVTLIWVFRAIRTDWVCIIFFMHIA